MRKFGDRKDGRRLRTVSPMDIVCPFIMDRRTGCMNMISIPIKLDEIDKFLAAKRDEGYKGISLMHVIVASYIRAVSQYPALNRYISGQRIFARNKIVVSLTIKQKMSIESPDTVIKVEFDPKDTIFDVYEKFNKEIETYRNSLDNDLDGTLNVLRYFPRFLLKFFISIIKSLDYFGFLPKFFENLSPFHSSIYITSLGSLGIPPVFHHLYDFGNVPIFIAFGAKYRKNEIDDEGNVQRKAYADMTFVLDERICDGYYFASSLKLFKKCFKNPSILETPPETVVQDIK